MSTISADNKSIAHLIMEAFGGKPIVREYLHDDLPLKMPVASLVDIPDIGVTSYSTIGLSDAALQSGDGEFVTRIELCAAADSSLNFVPNIIASAAFNILRKRIHHRSGNVMPNYVKEYYVDAKCPHLYFTSPFLWKNEFGSVRLQYKTVSWLLCFPISQKEYLYLEENGNDKFESLFQEAKMNIFDIDRESVC